MAFAPATAARRVEAVATQTWPPPSLARPYTTRVDALRSVGGMFDPRGPHGRVVTRRMDDQAARPQRAR